MIPNIRKSLTRLFASAPATPIAAPLWSAASELRRRTQDMAPVERARHLRYKRFAERQMLVEVEQEADHQRDRH